MLRNLSIVVAVYFIIAGGWIIFLSPRKPPICIVCGSPLLDLGTKVLSLALAVSLLVVALRTPPRDGAVRSGIR
jgi:hypothetical protein